MKIYTQTFDLTRPAPHRFWVAPNSDFKIGVKIVNGTEPSTATFAVKNGAVGLEPDEDKIDGFTTYTIKSGTDGFVEYTVEVEGVTEKFKILQIVTDSTVFDIDMVGGSLPPDVATRGWVESQISSFVTETDMGTAIGTATTDMATQTWVGSQVSALVTGGNVGQAPVLSAMNAVYASDWTTLSATANANTFYVVLPDPV
jgi:hypothetical protein